MAMSQREAWDTLVGAFLALHYAGTARGGSDPHKRALARERAYGMLDLWCSYFEADAEQVRESIKDAVTARVEIALASQ